MSTKRAWILPLAAVFVLLASAATGCAGDDDDGESGGGGGGTPSQALAADGTVQPTKAEAATLDRTAIGEAVAVANGATHDAHIAIDSSSGQIYVVWAQDGRENESTGAVPQDVLFASSDDDGVTFTKPRRVNDVPGIVSAGYNASPKVAVTGPNEVLVAWPSTTLRNGEYSSANLRVTRSSDGGKTWKNDGPVGRIADGKATSESYGALASNGKDTYLAFLDWRQYDLGMEAPGMTIGVGVVHSKNGGETFETTQRAELRTCGCCDNDVAIDSKGTVFVAFRNEDAAAEKTTMRDSAVVRSYDNGVTWSEPVELGDDDWVFNGCPESGPRILADAEDRLHGLYWTGKEERPGVYYTVSEDGGKSFATPITVATDDFYPPPYMGLTTDGSGSVWFVWDDRREKPARVHVARLSEGKLFSLDGALGDGQTPAIASHEGMVGMVWSDAEGLKFARLGAT